MAANNYVFDTNVIQFPRAPSGLPLKSGDGGGTYGGMEPWQQTVETRLGDLRGDVKGVSDKIDNRFFWLLGTLLGSLGSAFAVLLTILLSQVGEVRTDIKALTATVATQNERLARIETKLDSPRPTK